LAVNDVRYIQDASGFSVKEFYKAEHDFNLYLTFSNMWFLLLLLIKEHSFLEVGAAPPVDLFPILKYTPEFCASWKQQARKVRAEQQRIYYDILFKEIKAKIAKGETTDCWMEKSQSAVLRA
jgi:hypothetical protein